MKMRRIFSFVLVACALLVLALSAGCGTLKIDMPPLPTDLPEGTFSDLATPGPETPSTPEPPVPLPPSPSPTPTAEPEPTPAPTPDPLSLIPPPLPETSSAVDGGGRFGERRGNERERIWRGSGSRFRLRRGRGRGRGRERHGRLRRGGSLRAGRREVGKRPLGKIGGERRHVYLQRPAARREREHQKRARHKHE